MSDQLNEFDQVFREKLSGQAVPPPESVWDNIQAERSFGHVVANRMKKHWHTFGTLLLLLLGGGASMLFLGGKEEVRAENLNKIDVQPFAEIDQASAQIENQPANQNAQKKLPYSITVSPAITAFELNSENEQNQNLELVEEHIPDRELMASIQQAAFSKPELKDERLNSYISHLNGWETAKPVSFIHYYEMKKSPKLFIHKNEFIGSPLLAEKVEYDYVLPKVEQKTFRERASLFLAFTPQTIQKSMTPEYNLSTSYIEERAKTENTRLAYTLSAGLHYELKNHKFIETGINFTQIYEEMSYEGEKRFSNQYDFVEIPLLLGYEERSAKWGWHIKGGLGLQVFNNYKGYILKKIENPDRPQAANANNTPDNPQYRMKKSDAVVNIVTNNHELSEKQDRNGVYDLSNDDENPFVTSGVVNLHLAAGLTYYHSIKTSFVLAPHYSRSINSITKESARFKEDIKKSSKRLQVPL